jgi:hypothetical protein
MGLRHCNLSSNDLEIVFKRLSREKTWSAEQRQVWPKKDPSIAAQTTKCTKHTVASLGQGDEGSENGMFEDPLCSPLASMAWTLPVRADARVLPQVTSKKTLQCVQLTDAPAAIVRPSVRKRPRDNHGMGVVTIHGRAALFLAMSSITWNPN